MNEQPETVGKAIAEASFINYLDYVLRDELNKMIPAYEEWKNKPIEEVVRNLTENVNKRIVADYQDKAPEVMQNIGKMLTEIIKKL